MKKIVFIAAIMLLCPLGSRAWSVQGWISSGGSNPDGLLRVEIRDSIALIIAPDSSNGWNSVNNNHEWYLWQYRPQGNVTIPAYITYQGTDYPVRIIGWKALFYCGNITSITIPNTVKQIHNYAFGDIDYNTTTNGTVGGGNLNSVIFTGSIAQWCRIYFSGPHANPTIYTHTLIINGSPITSIDIPEGVTLIKDYAFSGCNLTSVTIPTTVFSIGKKAFSNCTCLTSVNYNAINCILEGSVQNFTDVFEGCTHLKTVTVGENVESFGIYAFSNISSLQTVYLKPLSPPIIHPTSFEGNASNRVFILSGCSYDDYYNNSQWSTYRDALRDPIIDIAVNASSSNTLQGTVTFIKQRNNIVHCDSTAVVQANAKHGYHFDHWSDGSTDNPYIIHLTGDTTITAYFATGTQGIESTEENDIIIRTENNHIIISKSSNTLHPKDVSVYDIMGRKIAFVKSMDSNVCVPVVPGIYLVKVCNLPTKKIIVLR